jgi:hypothetical protein
MPTPKPKPPVRDPRKDVENYSVHNIKGEPDSWNKSQAGVDRSKTYKYYRGADDSVMSRSAVANMAWQNSWIAKGEAASTAARAKKVAAKKAMALKAKQKDELTWSGGGMGKPDNSAAGKAYQKRLQLLTEKYKKESK